MAVSSALIAPQEYLRLEREADFRHEFVAGVLCEMAGGSRNHGEIQADFTFEVRKALVGRNCRILGSDIKVWISTREAYYYPDATISCPPNFIDEASGVIDNPTVILEVLSPSTKAIDRGQKFSDYRTLLSLMDYVLVDSESRFVEVYSRDRSTWTVQRYSAGSVFIPSLAIEVSIDEIYRNTTLP